MSYFVILESQPFVSKKRLAPPQIAVGLAIWQEVEAAEAARQEMVRQQRNAKRALLKEADKKEEEEDDGGTTWPAMTGGTPQCIRPGLFGMAYLDVVAQKLKSIRF